MNGSIRTSSAKDPNIPTKYYGSECRNLTLSEESDGDLMGDGVNIAARLESIAEPGGICLSEDAYSLRSMGVVEATMNSI